MVDRIWIRCNATKLEIGSKSDGLSRGWSGGEACACDQVPRNAIQLSIPYLCAFNDFIQTSVRHRTVLHSGLQVYSDFSAVRVRWVTIGSSLLLLRNGSICSVLFDSVNKTPLGSFFFFLFTALPSTVLFAVSFPCASQPTMEFYRRNASERWVHGQISLGTIRRCWTGS